MTQQALAAGAGVHVNQVKRYEAEWALDHGAVELDMVINISALKSGFHDVLWRGTSSV